MSEKKFFRLVDFSGGLNEDQHEMLLEDNECTDVLNFRLDKTGSLVTRNGTTAVSGFSVGANEKILQLGAWHNPKNLQNSIPLAKVTTASDGVIIRYNSTTSDTTAIATGFGSKRGAFANGEDYVIYSDGSRIPVVFDGTTALPMGIKKPEDPTVVEGAAGSWSTTWQFVITQLITVNGAKFESVASDPVEITVTNKRPVVTRPSLDTTDGVTNWNVYAWKTSDTNRVFMRVNSEPIAASSATYEVPADPDERLPLAPDPSNGVAPSLEKVAFFNGVYFGTIGNKLYWSKPLVPWHWPGENVTTLPFEGNDRVMGLASLQDSLVIFGRRNLLVVTGFYPSFSIVRVDAAIGLVGEDAVTELAGQAVFLSDEGIRVFPGLNVLGENVQRSLGGKTLSEKEGAILRASPRENSLWLTIGGQTYVVFLSNQGVSKYDLNPSAVLSGGATTMDWNWLTNTEGSQVYANEGDQDSGVDIPVLWRSKIFQMDNPETTKYIRRIGLFASRGSSANVTVSLVDASGASAVVTPTSQGVGVYYWGDFDWEDDGDPTTNYIWAQEGVVYFIGSLPGHKLVGMTLVVVISGNTSAGTEFVPPFTLLYRESLRFLGR